MNQNRRPVEASDLEARMRRLIVLAAAFFSLTALGRAATPLQKVGQVDLGNCPSSPPTLSISNDGQRLLKRDFGEQTSMAVYDVTTSKPVFNAPAFAMRFCHPTANGLAA